MTLAKKTAGYKALDYVEDRMVVGLGSGSTSSYFIQGLGELWQKGQLKDIKTVSTSKKSTQLAASYNLPVYDLDQVDQIDLLVDGADEVTLDYCGIKGGGGSLLYEKIVAQASNQIIWVVDEGKIVDQLGKFPLAVEVVKFGSFSLFEKFDQKGWKPSFRMVDGDSLFLSDDVNYIIDLDLGHIENPAELSFELNNTVGVIEHGLFLNYPDKIISSDEEGNLTIYQR